MPLHPPDWLYIAAIAVMLACFAVYAFRTGKSSGRRAKEEGTTPDTSQTRRKAAFIGAAVPALVALLVSLESAWEFTVSPAGLQLEESEFWLRLGTCSMAEVFSLGLAVRAWGTSSPAARYGSYLAVLVQTWAPLAMYDGVAAAWRCAAPVGLAFCLHQLLGLEAKLAKPKQDGLFDKLVKDRKNRLEARLGIGSRGDDAEAIARANAMDKAVDLATRRRPKTQGAVERRKRRLAAAADGALHGLHGPDERYEEGRLVDRIDRKNALRSLGDRKGTYLLKSLRPTQTAQDTLPVAPDDISALTSKDTPGHTPGHAPDTTETRQDETQSQTSPAADPQQLLAIAWDLYFDLWVNGVGPSQNRFVSVWHERKFGQSAATVRGLYKEIANKVNRTNDKQ